MSELTVQDMAGVALSIAYDQHDPVRVAHFAGGNGTWDAGEQVLFSPSGASGVVIAGSQSTHIVSFYLIGSIDPELGDSVMGDNGHFYACDSLTPGGDTFRNDGRTLLYVNNLGATDVTVRAIAAGRCSHGYLHDMTITISPGVVGQIGPFDSSRFNSTGIISVDYSGSLSPADLEVAAVRVLPFNS